MNHRHLNRLYRISIFLYDDLLLYRHTPVPIAPSHVLNAAWRVELLRCGRCLVDKGKGWRTSCGEPTACRNNRAAHVAAANDHKWPGLLGRVRARARGAERVLERAGDVAGMRGHAAMVRKRAAPASGFGARSTSVAVTELEGATSAPADAATAASTS